MGDRVNYLSSTLQPARLESPSSQRISLSGYSSAFLPPTTPNPFFSKTGKLDANPSFPMYPGGKLPSSYQQAKQMSTADSNLSGNVFTFNYQLMKWGDMGFENYMLSGFATFCLSEMAPDNARMGIFPLLDARSLGELHIIKSVHARKVLNDLYAQMPKDPALLSKTAVRKQHLFTYQDFLDLMNTPTKYWMNMPQFKRMTAIPDNDLECIRYLSPEWCHSRWRFVGYQWSDNDYTTPQHRSVAMCVGGVTFNAQNYWGPTIMPQESLYFSWQGLMNHEGEYLYTILKPIHCLGAPNEADLEYTSFNGFKSRGVLVHVGTYVFDEDRGAHPPQEVYDQVSGVKLPDNIAILVRILAKTARVHLPNRRYQVEYTEVV